MRKTGFLLAFLFLLSASLFGQDNSVHLVENKGQWPEQVLARTDLENGNLYFEKNRLTYNFVDGGMRGHLSKAHIGQDEPLPNDNKIKCHAVMVDFVGALSTILIEPENTQLTRYNYFLGKDQSKWVSNARAFGILNYQNIYDGIDLKFYSIEGSLKYDMIVAPGADPSKILMDYKGPSGMNIRNGNLNVNTSVNSWQEMKPYAYQEVGGKRQEVKCEYELKDGHLVSFKIGNYNKNLPLIIDPILAISTYSGSTADNFGYTATYDSEGFLYSGSSNLNGPGYPTTPGAYDQTYNGGNSDVAITKYDTTGKFRVYSTILGGAGPELPHSLVVDSKNQLVIFGTTGSSDFPVTAQAPQKSFKGGPPVDLSQGIDVNYNNGSDVYVCKLSFNGDDLLASTYLGGSGIDGINYDPAGPLLGLRYNYADEIRGEVLLDDLDNCYIVTSTHSTDIPGVSPFVFQPQNAGKMDGIIFKLDYSLNNILWTSYLGGSNQDAIFAIDINKDNFVVVSGGTISPDLPTDTSSPQQTFGGGRADGFIALISDDGRKLNRISYWGGPKYDQIYLHEFGPDNNVYVFGQTEETDGKFTFNHTGFGQPNSGQFITKFTEGLDKTLYSFTFGNGVPRPNLSPTAFLVDNCGNIYTTGWGGSVNMPGAPYNLARNNAQTVAGMPTTVETNPYFRNTTDNNDFHIMLLSQDAASLISGFYFGEVGGDDHVDGGTSRFDKRSQIYQSVCASCGSTSGFPATPGAVSSVNNGRRPNGGVGCNNAVFKIDFQSSAVSSDFSWTVNSCKNDTIQFANRSYSGLTYEWDFGDGSPVSTAANPYYIYPNEGVYNVTLRATNNTTCNKTDSITKRVVVYPVGKHLLPDTLLCLADTLQLGFNDYPGATYDWSPGRGLSDSTIANPYFYPDTIGNYQLIINGYGCIDTTNIRVTVDGVLAKFDHSPITCLGDTISFDNLSISADRYLWNFGDSTLSTTKNPKHYYDQPGVYTVRLYSTTFDPGPVCNPLDSMLKTIIIYPKGTHNLPDTVFCKNDTVRLNFQDLPGATYKWTPAAGLSSDTIANPLVYADTTRSYQLVMNAGGCLDVTNIRIIAHGVLAKFTHFPSTCETDSIRFTNKSSSATRYSWDFDGAGTSTDVSPKFAWTTPGLYNVRLVAYNDSVTKCPQNDTAYSPVVIYPRGSETLADTVVCRSDSTRIGRDPLPGGKYHWTPAAGLSSDTLSNPYVYGDSTRTYTLVSIGLSCYDTLRVTVIPQGVSADFVASKGTCSGDSVRFTNRSYGATSYLWDFGDGSPTSTAFQPAHFYTTTGTFKVKLISSTSNPGLICPAVDSVIIDVYVYPSGTTQLPDTLVCLDDTARIGYTPIPGSIYQWTPATGLSSDTVANPFAYPDSAGSYMLIRRAYGCIDTTYLKVNVAGVRANFDFTANLCQGDSVRFKDQSLRADQVSWKFGDGGTSTQRVVFHEYLQPGIYPVTLIATTNSPNGCNPTDSIVKEVIVYPNGSHTLPDTTICRSDTIQIGYPTLPGATYLWTPSDGVSDPTIADPIFYPDLPRTYTLVSIAAGCLDTTVFKINVEGPLANFVASPAICSNDTIFFTNTSVLTDSYQWDFGDGQGFSSTAKDPFHLYTSSGRFTVTLVGASNNSGTLCSPTDTVKREVIIYPTGRRFLPDTTICQRDTFNLGLDSLPGSTYQWSPSYGLNDPTYANPDIYLEQDTVYTIISTAGGCADTSTIRVKVADLKLIAEAQSILICDGPSYTLTAQSDGTVLDFTWSASADFSNPLNNGPRDSVIDIVPTTLTWYYVRGITANCIFTDSVQLLVAKGTTTALPDVDLCQGDSAHIGISINPKPGETFSWTPGIYLNDSTIPYPGTKGTDSIAYKLTAVLNGCYEYFTVNVNVRKFDLLAYADTFLCDPLIPLLLVADGKGQMSTFLWSNSPTYNPALNSPYDSTITVTPPGTANYYVKAKSGTCSYYDSVEVRADYFTLDIKDSLAFCVNKPLILDADGHSSGTLTYKWSPNTHIQGPDDTEQITVIPVGPEVITLTGTNSDGCIKSKNITIFPSSLSLLTADILASDTFFYKDIPITLTAQPAGPFTYSWTPAGIVSSDSNASTTAYATDSVWIHLTVSDGTCPTTDSIFIRYTEVICGPPNIFVPNAFTPNSDTENDLMLVRGNHIELLYFAVYDRWGEKMFETTDQKSGWDGTFNGKVLDPAVFVYYLQMTCKDRQTYFEKGNITLIR